VLKDYAQENEESVVTKSSWMMRWMSGLGPQGQAAKSARGDESSLVAESGGDEVSRTFKRRMTILKAHLACYRL